MAGVGRFRVNVLRESDTSGWRSDGSAPRTSRSRSSRSAGSIGSLAETRRGLILVTGPTGTGKTTTIAALLGFINRTRRAHIVTIEDPIEVVFTDAMSVIRQREVGRDTESYAAALRQSLRQDPDVIFLGEIRDHETALAAIQAAQTGHLVMSTMHTIDAAETISRHRRDVPARAAATDAHVDRRRAARRRSPSGCSSAPTAAAGCPPSR